MLELSAKTNLLEENDYRYSLQDVKDPVLYRDVYNYDEVPKVAFNHRRVPMSMPADIWITDTSFRDGQQSMNPYTPEQIEHLFKLLSKLAALRPDPPDGVFHLQQAGPGGHRTLSGFGAALPGDHYLDPGHPGGLPDGEGSWHQGDRYSGVLQRLSYL